MTLISARFNRRSSRAPISRSTRQVLRGASLVARKIIEIGQTGLKDPAKICVRAIEELGLPQG